MNLRLHSTRLVTRKLKVSSTQYEYVDLFQFSDNYLLQTTLAINVARPLA
jgi:hypothetical protein